MITCSVIFLDKDKHRNILSKVTEYLNKKVIQFDIQTSNAVNKVSWKKTVNLSFKYSDLYNTDGIKNFNHRFLNLPKDKIKYILKDY